MIVNIKEFNEHILNCFPQEACGIIDENGLFRSMENIASDPINNFEISEGNSFYIASTKEKYSLIHSHTMISYKDDPRIPSYEDMKGKIATNIPWGIVHCDGENVSDILWIGEINAIPYEGRDYLSNITDCFTLARDFYSTEFKIDLGIHPRPAIWEEWNPHYIEQTYKNLGFTDVSSNFKYGDILLFSIGARYINHIGIYLEDDKFLHHLYKHKSAIDSITKWNRQLVKVIRFHQNG
jgi:proteasome lid subunit RPN8/RPN11